MTKNIKDIYSEDLLNNLIGVKETTQIKFKMTDNNYIVVSPLIPDNLYIAISTSNIDIKEIKYLDPFDVRKEW